MPQEPTVAISLRVPPDIAAAVDAKAKALEAASGMLYNRTDIVRMALARFLGLVETPNENAAQPTP